MKQVKVFDTWVQGKNEVLHFDVCVNADAKDADKIALKLAEEYLKSRGGRVARLPRMNASSVTLNRLQNHLW